MDCWFLVISLITSTPADSTSSTVTTFGLGQLTQTGPMSHEKCAKAATALKAANPDWSQRSAELLVELDKAFPGLSGQSALRATALTSTLRDDQ
jgi:hypothetical protein